MKLTVDFETRSQVDIKKRGMYVYAEDPTTDASCLAVKVDDEAPRIWIRPYFLEILPKDHGLPLLSEAEVFDLVNRADTIEAHNAGFEFAIWNLCCAPKYGWQPLPLEKMRCSAAKAAMHALPRALGQVCDALRVDQQKDTTGYRIMLKLCKPRNMVKKDYLEALCEAGNILADLQKAPLSMLKSEYFSRVDSGEITPKIYWHEDPQDYIAQFRYCLQDVESEHSMSRALRDLPDSELKLWMIDQKANFRGIPVDIPTTRKILETIEDYSKILMKEIKRLTGGTVKSPKQVKAFLEYLKFRGLELEDAQSQTIEEALRIPDLEPDVRRLLEIRASLSKASVAKYNAFLDRASADSRVRGALLYHGASTGRWSGQGIQPQNMPRGNFKDIDEALSHLDDPEFLDALWGGPLNVASTCVRSMICAPRGKEFICSDYSAIEARVTAWLAGEQGVLDAFVEGLDLYKVAATDIYNKTYGEITKAERQIGKVVILACGYQGFVGAFQSMAKNYGVQIEDEKAAEIVGAWREKNQHTVALWRGLESACLQAVCNRGRVFSYRNIAFKANKRFLMMKLPSGRNLYYFRPHTIEKETPWGEMKTVVAYYGVNSQTRKFEVIHTYGGKLTENAVQAISRDLMVHGIFQLEGAGYPVCFTVHDEVISEVDEGFGSVEEFEALMANTPDWAAGCPVKADGGWRGRRYRK